MRFIGGGSEQVTQGVDSSDSDQNMQGGAREFYANYTGGEARGFLAFSLPNPSTPQRKN